VLTAIPLHQFAVPRPSGTPDMRLFDPRSPPPPQLGLDQLLPQGLAADRDPVLLG
jgi:hypothetical protein